MVDNDLNIIKQISLSYGDGFDIASAVLTNDNVECMILNSERDTKLV